MNYVIFDLEWNRLVKAVKTQCPDEIIQIGAVKYNSNMKCIGNFSRLIRPVLYKRLDSAVGSLTKLEFSILKRDGIPFSQAVKDFKKFIGQNSVLMSWGAQDVHILRSNCLYFNANTKLHFLKKFVDVQRYVTHLLSDKTQPGNQLSVKYAADLTGIRYDAESLHDALVDATVSGMVFAKLFDPERFNKYIVDASAKNFNFKDMPITDLNNKLVDKQVFKIRCPECGRFMRKKRGWYLNGNKFLSTHTCRKCRRQYICSVEILKTYGNIMKYKKRMKLVKPEKAAVRNN